MVTINLTLSAAQLNALTGLLDHEAREAHLTGSAVYEDMYRELENLIHRAVDVAVGRSQA